MHQQDHRAGGADLGQLLHRQGQGQHAHLRPAVGSSLKSQANSPFSRKISTTSQGNSPFLVPLGRAGGKTCSWAIRRTVSRSIDLLFGQVHIALCSPELACRGSRLFCKKGVAPDPLTIKNLAHYSRLCPAKPDSHGNDAAELVGIMLKLFQTCGQVGGKLFVKEVSPPGNSPVYSFSSSMDMPMPPPTHRVARPRVRCPGASSRPRG